MKIALVFLGLLGVTSAWPFLAAPSEPSPSPPAFWHVGGYDTKPWYQVWYEKWRREHAKRDSGFSLWSLLAEPSSEPSPSPPAFWNVGGYDTKPWYQVWYEKWLREHANTANAAPASSSGRGDCACADKSISLDEKLRLLGADNDHNGDGVVTSSDIIYDVTNRYDTNKDGVWTENECVKRWACAYGDSTLTATFICVQILQGKANMSISSFNDIPAFATGVPLATFLQTNRARYQRFVSDNCTKRCLTIEEKVQYNAQINDYDKDGYIRPGVDVVHDLRTYYDTNHDLIMDKFEWVTRWTCFYADTGDFARYLWNDIFYVNKTFVDLKPRSTQEYPPAMTVTAFINRNRQYFVDFYQGENTQKCVESDSRTHLIG